MYKAIEIIDDFYTQEQLNIQQVRKDFISYVDEYDKRRNKNFRKTIHELEDFYNTCK